MVPWFHSLERRAPCKAHDLLLQPSFGVSVAQGQYITSAVITDIFYLLHVRLFDAPIHEMVAGPCDAQQLP